MKNASDEGVLQNLEVAGSQSLAHESRNCKSFLVLEASIEMVAVVWLMLPKVID